MDIFLTLLKCLAEATLPVGRFPVLVHNSPCDMSPGIDSESYFTVAVNLAMCLPPCLHGAKHTVACINNSSKTMFVIWQ